MSVAEQDLSSTLWYDRPAEIWNDALPIGNGVIGAMVFGRTTNERLALNHENLWRGVTRHRTTEPRHQYLQEIRELLLAGKWIEGQSAATKHLSGTGQVQPYQPVCDLSLQSAGETGQDYRRSLDMATAIAVTHYRQDEVLIQRDAFVSAVHGALVLQLRGEQPGQISTTIALVRRLDEPEDEPDLTITTWASRTTMGLSGSYIEGVSFAVEARVQADGVDATVEADEASGTLRVSRADSLLLVLTIATNYDVDDPEGRCRARLDNVPLDYAQLREAHIAEYAPLHARVQLDLGRSADANRLPTDQRKERLCAGQSDPALHALYFQYGRYLLLSSSRACQQPANLQGIWNDKPRPPWDSDFHHDANLQMNYWPAETCNMPECVDPLSSYLMRQIPEARKAARNLYHCSGITMPILSDVWDRATPEAPGWDVWIGAAPWLSQHLWWHWEFERDRDYLRDVAYPFLKLNAEFYADYLIRDASGYLVPVPSQSPENTWIGGPWPVGLGVAATMDLVLIHEVLQHCLEASTLLEVDADLRPTWNGILRDLPPFQIGKHSQLQEWYQDFDEREVEHRHYSHLIGVYPGDLMTPSRLHTFYEAARVSIQRRVDAGASIYGMTAAWSAAMWTRFGEGDRAFAHLQQMICDFTTRSLLNISPRDVFQIDGNFAATASYAELFLQSHDDRIQLLPALPEQWSMGSVAGLRARGDFTVDITWQNGAWTEVRITSYSGEPCRVVGRAIVADASGMVSTRTYRDGIEWDTTAGQSYLLRRAEAAP